MRGEVSGLAKFFYTSSRSTYFPSLVCVLFFVVRLYALRVCVSCCVPFRRMFVCLCCHVRSNFSACLTVVCPFRRSSVCSFSSFACMLFRVSLLCSLSRISVLSCCMLFPVLLRAFLSSVFWWSMQGICTRCLCGVYARCYAGTSHSSVLADGWLLAFPCICALPMFACARLH